MYKTSMSTVSHSRLCVCVCVHASITLASPEFLSSQTSFIIKSSESLMSYRKSQKISCLKQKAFLLLSYLFYHCAKHPFVRFGEKVWKTLHIPQFNLTVSLSCLMLYWWAHCTAYVPLFCLNLFCYFLWLCFPPYFLYGEPENRLLALEEERSNGDWWLQGLPHLYGLWLGMVIEMWMGGRMGLCYQ